MIGVLKEFTTALVINRDGTIAGFQDKALVSSRIGQSADNPSAGGGPILFPGGKMP
jgi:hypothetical protein